MTPMKTIRPHSMTRRFSNLGFAFSLLLLGCTLPAICGAAAAATTVLPRGAVAVWSADDEFVVLLPADASSAANAHPATLSEGELVAALTRIKVLRDRKEWPLITAAAARRIAPHLAAAFARATPQQDVGFAAITEIDAELFGHHSVGVAARAFYANKQLSLIVGDLHASTISQEFFRSPGGDRKIDRRLHPHMIGSRAKETVHRESKLESAPGIALAASRPDWLLVDVALVAQTETRPETAGAKPAVLPPRATERPSERASEAP